MDWQRATILAAILAVSLLLIREWVDFNNRPQLVEATSEQSFDSTTTTDFNTESASSESGFPQVEDQESSIPQIPSDNETKPALSTENELRFITVKTDTLNVTINPHGGDIIALSLADHLRDLDSDEPLVLLEQNKKALYIAQSGLIGKNGTDFSDTNRPIFSVAQTEYQLADDNDTLNVDLNYQQGDVAITKRFSFQRGEHLIGVEYIINNQSSENWSGIFFGQIKRDGQKPEVKGGAGFGVQPYWGAAITTPDDKYKKLDFGDIAEDEFEVEQTGGWVAMVQHYFISAWIPPQESKNVFNLKEVKDAYLLTFRTSKFFVPAGEKHAVKAQFYAGPKDIDRLEKISPYLDLTVDYGWLWWIAKPLFHILQFIHSVVASWGWSIILLTVLIKAIFYVPSAIGFRSMAKMRKLGPKMAELKERYGEDRQKMSAELMKIYRKEGVNPMTGCLPILIQMPVFLSLYWVLLESVQLRHTPFLGYIDDLSVMDPYFILPIIMGVTMLIQQKLQPAPADPMQARVMQFLPIMFTVMFIFFPAGLVLYWVVNNSLSILQQWIITRKIDAEG